MCSLGQQQFEPRPNPEPCRQDRLFPKPLVFQEPAYQKRVRKSNVLRNLTESDILKLGRFHITWDCTKCLRTFTDKVRRPLASRRLWRWGGAGMGGVPLVGPRRAFLKEVAALSGGGATLVGGRVVWALDREQRDGAFLIPLSVGVGFGVGRAIAHPFGAGTRNGPFKTPTRHSTPPSLCYGLCYAMGRPPITQAIRSPPHGW